MDCWRDRALRAGFFENGQQRCQLRTKIADDIGIQCGARPGLDWGGGLDAWSRGQCERRTDGSEGMPR